MGTREKGRDIGERLLDLSVSVLHAVERLPSTRSTRHIESQLVRAVTSAGANYEEARHAESLQDFLHKIGVATKEAGETLYWLKLLSRIAPEHAAPELMREADELLAILIASGRTARRRL